MELANCLLAMNFSSKLWLPRRKQNRKQGRRKNARREEKPMQWPLPSGKSRMRKGRHAMRKSDGNIMMHCNCGRKNKIMQKQSADGLDGQSPKWENSKQQCLDQNCRQLQRARERRRRMKEKMRMAKICLIDLIVPD